MDVGQALGVGVAGHHNMRLFRQKSLEGIKKLFLGTLFVGQELHVVNQEQIQRVVALFELIKCLALIGFNHITDKLLSMDVENSCIWTLSQQTVANRVHEVGFAQADAAVNKQRVVQVARHACYVHGCRPRHAVCPALDQRVKVQARIEPIFLGFGGAPELRAKTVIRG